MMEPLYKLTVIDTVDHCNNCPLGCRDVLYGGLVCSVENRVVVKFSEMEAGEDGKLEWVLPEQIPEWCPLLNYQAVVVRHKDREVEGYGCWTI